MSDLVTEAANALAPVIAAGGTAAADQLAAQLGRGFVASANRILARLRGPRPETGAVEPALRAALARGDVTIHDLQELLTSRTPIAQAGQVNIGVASGNLVVGGSVDIADGVHFS